MPLPENPQTREEMYLNGIATGSTDGLPDAPVTREEMYLDYIARNAGGGGGGGSSTLAGLTDVDLSNPTDGQTLVYNSTSGKWENGDTVFQVLHAFTELDGTFSDHGHDVYKAVIDTDYSLEVDSLAVCFTNITINGTDYPGPFYTNDYARIILDENHILQLETEWDTDVIFSFSLDYAAGTETPETITISGYFYYPSEKLLILLGW